MHPADWKRAITTSLAIAITVGVAFVIGAFFVGPSRVKAEGGVISTAVLDMPCGILSATDTNGERGHPLGEDCRDHGGEESGLEWCRCQSP